MKKIIIFSSIGGGGHKSVSNALKNKLGNRYKIKIVNIISEIFFKYDPFQKVAPSFSGEEFYNLCLSAGKIKLINNLCKFGLKTAQLKRLSLTKTVLDFLKKEKPDLIISVIPIFNAIILDAATKKDIPFIIVTVDLDTKNYINGIENPNFKKFKYILPFNYEDINKKIQQANIKKEQIEYFGFPLRQDFLEKINKKEAKREFNLPENKFTILLMMGAQGSKRLINFVEELSKLDLPIHIIIMFGKKESLKSEIENIKFNENVSYTLIGFTERVATLMAASDVFITKTGPNSIMEAIYMELPIIVDNTSKLLFWEKLNRDFVSNNRIGDKIDKIEQLNLLIKKFYQNKDYYQNIKNNLKKIEKKNFIESFSNLIDEILE